MNPAVTLEETSVASDQPCAACCTRIQQHVTLGMQKICLGPCLIYCDVGVVFVHHSLFKNVTQTETTVQCISKKLA